MAATTAEQIATMRDRRGVARALTGDVAAALDDFNFYVEQAGGNTMRKSWMERLTTGEAPTDIFDTATMEALENE